MKLELSQLGLDGSIFIATRDDLLHPGGFGQGILLGTDLHRVIMRLLEEVEQARATMGEALAKGSKSRGGGRV